MVRSEPGSRVFFLGKGEMVVRNSLACIGTALFAALLLGSRLQADVQDPFDPFDYSIGQSAESQNDDDKTPDQLVAEAAVMLDDDRPLDARTKLLKALAKDPQMYRAHLMLATYYMVHVGHFRLALRYVKQAQDLFFKKNGQPPYTDFIAQSEHAHILYLLSQARLNLDNYQGALDVLDEFTSFGYYADWYAGTRAWVLMKLGRVDEAVKVARLGIALGAEKGRTLNMLGILLSMTGEREQSLQVFDQAIRYEMSLGSAGQPATPLNNSGEVLKEIFKEDKAQAAWLKSTSLPDGCEHVLPSLNLALVYLDELNLKGAKKAMDDFLSCVAQYKLRNGEEHRALVNLANGRVALMAGFPETAIKLLRLSLEHQQWFGKIGTDIDDLRAAAMSSLGQALRAAVWHRKLRSAGSLRERFAYMRLNVTQSLEAWWYERRARQILIENLSQFEDIYVRNTDSLIDYPVLGALLAPLPESVLDARIGKERDLDKRDQAALYYDAYRAENRLYHGDIKEALALIDAVLGRARARYDDALRLHLLLLKLTVLDVGSEDYRAIAYQAFSLNRAALRNNGLKLPVRLEPAARGIQDDIADGPFTITDEAAEDYSINYELKDGEHHLMLNSKRGLIGRKTLATLETHAPVLEEALKKFSDIVFSEEL